MRYQTKQQLTAAMMLSTVWHTRPKGITKAAQAQAVQYWVDVLQKAYTEGIDDMPAKKAPTKAVWKGFADVPLDAESKKLFRSLEYTDSETLDKLSDFVAEGYKVSISFRPEQNSFMAAATGVRQGSPNEGYTMTSFAANIDTAIQVMLFKHYELCGGDWTEYAPRDGDDIG